MVASTQKTNGMNVVLYDLLFGDGLVISIVGAEVTIGWVAIMGSGIEICEGNMRGLWSVLLSSIRYGVSPMPVLSICVALGYLEL